MALLSVFRSNPLCGSVFLLTLLSNCFVLNFIVSSCVSTNNYSTMTCKIFYSKSAVKLTLNFINSSAQDNNKINALSMCMSAAVYPFPLCKPYLTSRQSHRKYSMVKYFQGMWACLCYVLKASLVQVPCIFSAALIHHCTPVRMAVVS